MEALEALLSAIRVNTHSSIRIQAPDKVVYIDPFRLPDAPHDADLVFVTHDHYDHYSPEDLEKVCKPGTAFVMAESTAKLAAGPFGSHAVTAVRPGDSGVFGDLRWEAVPAYNPNKPFHPKQNAWVGYVLTVGGLRVYIAGDTDATDEAAAVRCDVALLPIGGKYTADAKEAAALAEALRPQAVIPIHYGSVTGSPRDYDRFAKAVSGKLRVCKKIV